MDGIIAFILLFLMIVLIRIQFVKRRDLKLIQSRLDVFNIVFEKSKSFFENEDKLQKELEVYIGKDVIIIETTKGIVEFLLDLAHDILIFEEELIGRYGEMNYNYSYYNFRENLERTRKIATKFSFD